MHLLQEKLTTLKSPKAGRALRQLRCGGAAVPACIETAPGDQRLACGVGDCQALEFGEFRAYRCLCRFGIFGAILGVDGLGLAGAWWGRLGVTVLSTLKKAPLPWPPSCW